MNVMSTRSDAQLNSMLISCKLSTDLDVDTFSLELNSEIEESFQALDSSILPRTVPVQQQRRTRFSLKLSEKWAVF